MAVGDNQAEIAGAGLIHARKINLIENAVTQREPDSAVQVQRGARATFGARRPAGWDSGPTRGMTNRVAQRNKSSPSSSLPEDARLCGEVSSDGSLEHLNRDMTERGLMNAFDVHQAFGLRLRIVLASALCC